jgi:class 3 adenylate cyclase
VLSGPIGRYAPPVAPSRDWSLLEREIEAINKFPGQNPNPVLRMTDDGVLSYANAASAPIVAAWGTTLGQPLPPPVVESLRAALRSEPPGRVEVTWNGQTFAVLPIAVPDLEVTNLYGTDVTANKVVERFPGRNPNPVLRMSPDGDLLYANDASEPITAALGLLVGARLPAELLDALQAKLADGDAPTPEVPGSGGRTYRVTPVLIPEFDFVNLYGTDITAARLVERLNAENEALLLNILPRTIAERLRGGETVIADRFDDMAVLFADVVGFTELSSRLSPTEVVSLLNDVFTTCDRLADRFGLEKIKTVGDAYMVAGGLGIGEGGAPGERPTHAADVADMGLAMLTEVDRLGAAKNMPLRIRVGMNVGPAVAGVIGLKKFIYDVWGDTVNTASRMESTGIPGRFQVTPETHARLQDEFEFERRGPIEVKGKGTMETWFLLRRKASR